MRSVDVTTEIVVDRPPGEVAAFATNPDNVPIWYERISRVAWETDPPLEVGSRLAFRARFLGRTLEYTYEVVEHVPGRRLVMQTAQGPFPMQTTYTWEPAGQGTRMTLRNHGRPGGGFRLLSPLMASAVRRANRRDLERLKSHLERPAT